MNLLRTLLAILFFTTVLAPVFLAGANSSTQISPGFVEMLVGDIKEINIRNDSEVDKNFEIELVPLEIRNGRISPAESEKIDNRQFIQLSNETIEVPAGQERSFQVEMISTPLNNLIGVAAKEEANTGEQVSINSDLIVTVISLQVDEGTYASLTNDIEINSVFEIFGFAVGSNFEAISNVQNSSSSLLKFTGGEIRVFDKDTKIGQKSLTQNLGTYIYPSSGFKVENEFDFSNRGIIERFGETRFNQRVSVNGVDFIIEKQVFVVPVEILVILGVLITSVASISIFGTKKYLDSRKQKG